MRHQQNQKIFSRTSNRILLTILAAAAMVSLTACADHISTASNSRNSRNWGHFTMASQEIVDASTISSPMDDCETKIRKAVCLVDPIEYEKVASVKRTCLPESQNYQGPVLNIYQQLPSQFQKMFCSLKVIYIEKELFSIGYGGILVSDDHPTGNFMGIRKSVFDQPVSFEEVLTWKEQKLFGIQQKPFTFKQESPRVSLKGPALENSALLYVMLHEMGHLFDFNNDVTTDLLSGKPIEKSAWNAIRRQGETTQGALHVFNDKICFYNCQGKHLDETMAASYYAALEKSDYITSYSMVTALEDFAESTAVYFMKKEFGREFIYSVNGAPAYNASVKLESPQFALKARFLQSFFEGNIVFEKAW